MNTQNTANVSNKEQNSIIRDGTLHYRIVKVSQQPIQLYVPAAHTVNIQEYLKTWCHKLSDKAKELVSMPDLS